MYVYYMMKGVTWEQQREETLVVADSSLLQEMLKRQMDSVRHRTTSKIENDRLQEILQQQRDYSKYHLEVVAG